MLIKIAGVWINPERVGFVREAASDHTQTIAMVDGAEVWIRARTSEVVAAINAALDRRAAQERSNPEPLPLRCSCIGCVWPAVGGPYPGTPFEAHCAEHRPRYVRPNERMFTGDDAIAAWKDDNIVGRAVTASVPLNDGSGRSFVEVELDLSTKAGRAAFSRGFSSRGFLDGQPADNSPAETGDKQGPNHE